MPGPLAAGERVLLIDPKDRRYLLTLVSGATFHTHAGVLAHDDIIGAAEGCRVTGSTGRSFLVLRPDAERHRAQDAPGGPGHLPQGPRRHPHRGRHRARAARPRGGRRLGGPLHDRPARRGVHRRLRAPRGLRRAGPGQRGGHAGPRRALPGRDPRRDRGHRRDRSSTGSCSTCPSPTRWSPPRRRPCAPGGILLAYLPTINQTALLRQALDEDGAPFGLAETQEIMRRTWHVEARSVRPDHRMVGHTGFLTTARRLEG